ncbi:MAG: VWA domain-containing protein [Rhodospirillales bacterium]
MRVGAPAGRRGRTGLFGAWALLAAASVFGAAAAGAAEVHLADDSLLGAGSPPPAHRRPVLFVHGHNPTDDDADFNYRKNWQDPLGGLPSVKAALDLPDNAGLGIEPYYIRFTDQDRSITEDAAEIAEAVGVILRRHDPSFDPGDPNDTTPVQVAIVAYSKGTISTRQYLKSLQVQVAGMPAPRPDFRPVSEFVAISPPNHGIDTVLFATTTSLAVRQLYNGYRPQGVFFDCGDSFGTPAALDYIEALNGHPIEDTLAAPFGGFASEAPGSRADGAPPSDGVLYVTLYAAGNRDSVGGDAPSGDCQGRKVARNLAPQAINIPVAEVAGGNEVDVHQNTVHTKEVICQALFAVVHQRSPLGETCSSVGEVPIVPPPQRAAAMLALDLSGSMLAPGCPGCASRLDVLKDSTELFIQLWSLLGRPEDRLGVTYFRTDVDQPSFGGSTLPLLVGNEAALIGHVGSQATVPANLTAMGGALQRAIEALADPAVPAERRKVILFTDGMQNVNPMVRAVASSPPRHDIGDEAGRPASNVVAAAPPIRLDTLPGITVDTIGVGAGQAFLDLLGDIAAQSGGGTRATTAPDDDLRRFFVEEVIGALRGFSPQLVAWRRGATGGAGTASEPFVVNERVRKLVLKLSWRRGRALDFRVLKDGVDMTAAGRVVSGGFYRFFVIDRPASGQWRLAIAGKPGVAYEAAAIVDEHRLGYAIALGRSPSFAGVPLELSVRLAAGGRPLVRDVVVDAVVQRPRTAVGNVVAASGRPVPAIGEPGDGPGERRLLGLASSKTSWPGLAPAQARVTLRHAGDGLYRATLATPVPGVYTVRVSIRGRDPVLGRFERAETATAIVRFGPAVLSLSSPRLSERAATGPDRTIELVLRPTDRQRNRLGPALASRLAATLSAGRVVGPQDLGDGRYLFRLSVPRSADPTVTLSVGPGEIFSGTLKDLRRMAGG